MTLSFYQDFICINVLAKTPENAADIYEKTEGHCLIGLLSTNYTSIIEARKEIRTFYEATNGAISIGLGGGNPEQWKMVCDIVRENDIPHINQVFPKIGYTHGISKSNHSWINGLVHPTEKLGYVNIATGPRSRNHNVSVPVETAITFIKEMGGNALKLFPLKGLKQKEHYKRIAEICAEKDFPLEPTGGITVDNFRDIISIAKDAGVKKLIPHVYSAIIDESTGWTDTTAVKELFTIVKEVTD